MEIKKVLRKITAIAASASFIGATMLGAVAQDLATYPAPFVKDGMFDAVIVVGQSAQTEDVVGAVDVGASLQFALKKATSVNAGAAEATIDEGVKIQKSSDKLNYDEMLADVLSTITEEELPSVLADGKFVESQGDNRNNAGYTQELELLNTNGQLVYTQNDEAPKAGDYLAITSGDDLYTYTLEFDETVEFNVLADVETASDDLKTSTIAIQGKTYTITDVEADATGITKMTLLSGEAVLWLTQNQPIKKTISGVEHTVEVLDVTDPDAEDCQIKVDDVTALIAVDETKTINGVQIGVTNAKAIHAQLQDTDICQVSLGASEVVLNNDDGTVKVDDEEVYDATVVFDTADGEWDNFVITYNPDLDDDLYLKSGQAYVDPIFGSWKFAYGGVTADYETYNFKATGDTKAKFTFLNTDGKTIEIPYFMDDAGTVTIATDDPVTDPDEQIYAENGGSAGVFTFATVCTSAAGLNDCEGMKVLTTDDAGAAHMLEVTKLDFNDDDGNWEADITDTTYGRTYSAVDLDIGGGIDLGSLDTILELNTDVPGADTATTVTVLNSIRTSPETKAGASIQAIDIDTVTISELGYDDIQKNIPDEMTESNIELSIDDLDADDELEVALVAIDNEVADVEMEEDSDFQVHVSEVGTIVTVNTDTDDSVVVQMPKAEVYGNAFVAPIVAKVSSAEGGMTAYTLSKLNVGAAKLDSEVSDASAQNTIVVGGPCANKVAASVLGLTFPACGDASGIAKDTGMIKEVVQQGGKVALVVAGWEAIDTRRATRVLANYDSYKADLTGSSVVVTGTSLTDITVKKSA